MGGCCAEQDDEQRSARQQRTSASRRLLDSESHDRLEFLQLANRFVKVVPYSSVNVGVNNSNNNGPI